jgi:hypothetical protein
MVIRSGSRRGCREVVLKMDLKDVERSVSVMFLL